MDDNIKKDPSPDLDENTEEKNYRSREMSEIFKSPFEKAVEKDWSFVNKINVEEKEYYFTYRLHEALEDWERFAKEMVENVIKKEEKLKFNFGDEVKCVIQYGCVRIPWDFDVINDQFTWMIIKNGHKMKIIFTFSDCYFDIKDHNVWRQGKCEFSEYGDWILPNIVLCFLKEKSCVWVGREGFAELMTEREYKRTQKGFNKDDSFKKSRR